MSAKQTWEPCPQCGELLYAVKRQWGQGTHKHCLECDGPILIEDTRDDGTTTRTRINGRTSNRPANYAQPPTDWDHFHLTKQAPEWLLDHVFRGFSKRLHPDTGGDTAKMQELTAAYTRLKETYKS